MRVRKGVTPAQRGMQVRRSFATFRSRTLLASRLRMLLSAAQTAGGRRWVRDRATAAGIDLDD